MQFEYNLILKALSVYFNANNFELNSRVTENIKVSIKKCKKWNEHRRNAIGI